MSSTPFLTHSSPPVTGTTTGAVSVGAQFTVNSGQSIDVTDLGIFDSGGNGIVGTRTVYLSDSGGTTLASVSFTADGTLEGAFRYKPISPLTLTAGSYTVWVDSASASDPAWNSTNAGTFAATTFGGKITVGSSVFGTAGSMPTTAFVVIGASFKVLDTANPVALGTVSLSAAASLSAPVHRAASLSASLSAVASLSAPLSVTPPSTSGGAIQCQRTAYEVEPGFLPGAAAFDGTEGEPFGDDAKEMHDTTEIVFTGLFRGGARGQVLGTTVSLPVEEVGETDVFSVVTTYATPHPAGAFVPRPSSFSLTDTPIQGVAHNIEDGEHYGLLESINSQIRNDTGTPASVDLVPRTREWIYARLWADAAPDGTLLAMATSSTRRVFRMWKDTDDHLVIDFWGNAQWVSYTTALSATGDGAMSFDAQFSAVLWIALEDGSGGISLQSTDDEGRSFSMAIEVTDSGNNPATCASDTGLLYVFWTDGDTIKSTAYDPSGNVAIAERTVVAANVADSPLAATTARVKTSQQEHIYLTYRDDANRVVSVVSVDGGLTYS